MKDKIKTSDPGLAANVAARASILYARVSGYNAENEIRKSHGLFLAYGDDWYESAIDECFPELQEKEKK